MEESTKGTQMSKPVCLVIGAGAGIGGNVAKKFAMEGYHSFLCRRSDEEGLNTLVSQIEAEGGSASGYLLNAAQDGAIEERIAAVEAVGNLRQCRCTGVCCRHGNLCPDLCKDSCARTACRCWWDRAARCSSPDHSTMRRCTAPSEWHRRSTTRHSLR